MKLLFFVLLLLPTVASSQTIQITPITKTTYCVGDTLTLSFTTTGSFEPDNIFIAQLSAVRDSFKTFTNLGTDHDQAGYFKIKLNQADSQYIFRVVSSNPIATSNYVGSDIVVIPYPSAAISARGYLSPSLPQCRFPNYNVRGRTSWRFYQAQFSRWPRVYSQMESPPRRELIPLRFKRCFCNVFYCGSQVRHARHHEFTWMCFHLLYCIPDRLV